MHLHAHIFNIQIEFMYSLHESHWIDVHAYMSQTYYQSRVSDVHITYKCLSNLLCNDGQSYSVF